MLSPEASCHVGRLLCESECQLGELRNLLGRRAEGLSAGHPGALAGQAGVEVPLILLGSLLPPRLPGASE